MTQEPGRDGHPLTHRAGIRGMGKYQKGEVHFVQAHNQASIQKRFNLLGSLPGSSSGRSCGL